MLYLYLIDYSSQNNSGLTTYVSQLSSYISKEKEIRLNFIFVNATNFKEIQKEIKHNVTRYYVPHDVARPLNHELDEQLANYLRQETSGKENVLFHFNWINHAPFAQSLKKKIHCKAVLTKHCIPWRDLVTSAYPLFRSLNNQLASSTIPSYLDHALVREWVSYQSVDHIICVTQLAQNSLHRLFKYPLEKTNVIQNGLRLNPIKNLDKDTLKKKYGFDQNEQIIFFAGTINARKGVFDLVSAFDKLLEKTKNVRLVIAGDGDYRGIFQHTKRNWAKLTITGFLDKRTLYEFYHMADVGVVPSYIEQCSYTTIEMMHHGLPIIVADVDGLAELIQVGHGLRIPLVLGKRKAFLPSRKLAANLLDVLKNIESAKVKAISAKQHAILNLSGEKMASETLAVYLQLMLPSITPPATAGILTVNPLVSILLPCHNGEKYLKACIDSVLGQTYANFELIIIDDGSTDSTSQLVKSYHDNRIKVFYNLTKLGIVSTLNRAIKQAKGQYIARIDTDDMMREDRLYKQVEYLEKDENQAIALVGSHHYVVNETGNIIGLTEYPISPDEIRNTMLFQNPFSHPSVMIRAAIIKKLGYSKKYPHAEDYHLWFRILKNHSASNIPECLTYYRVHGKNVSTQNRKEQIESAGDLICTELDKLAIDYSVEELTTHLAICQGLRAKFFKNEERYNSLDSWLEKVLRSRQHNSNYPDEFLKEIKSHIKRFYCGIY